MTNKWLVILVCGVLAAGCATTAQRLASAPAAPKVAEPLKTGSHPVRIVCVGDSVTGVYYHTGGRRAYAEMIEIALKRACPSARVSVINAGISGNTTVDAIARLDKDVLVHQPQLVTIMFGLNDVTRVPIDDYASNLTALIERCRAAGAEALLCTPNAVVNTESRPIAKLERYAEAMRDVGARTRTPVVDCYAGFTKVRVKDESEFLYRMSDEIHPNMDGHKLFAEMIAGAILGKKVDLSREDAPFPALPRTLALLDEGKPVRVYAMPPYDTLMAKALRASYPSADLRVTSWPVDGKTLPQLEADSKAVREMGVDLVVGAVPAEAGADTPEQYGRSYRWVMNNALSFGRQEWDVVAFPPSLAKPRMSGEESEKDAIARRLIRAQDLGSLSRDTNNKIPAERMLARWVRKQVAAQGK